MRWLLLMLAGTSTLACTKQEGSSPAEAPASPALDAQKMAPPSDTPDTEPRKGAASEAMLVRSDYDDEHHSCVKTPDGSCLRTMEEVRKAYPTIVADAKEDKGATNRLVQASHHLFSNMTVVFKPDEQAKEIVESQRPSDLAKISRMRIDDTPDPTYELAVPRWEGDTLVYQAYKPMYVGNGHYFLVQEFRVDTTQPKWKAERSDIKAGRAAQNSTKAALEAAFGGSMKGIVPVALKEGPLKSLLFAISPASKAARVVALAPDGTSTPFGSWNELYKAHPEVGSTKNLARIADNLYYFLADLGVKNMSASLIPDAAAFKKTYRKEGHETVKVRYHATEYKEYRFDCTDFESVADPSVDRKGKLVAYFKANWGQPHRLDFDLGNLTLDSPRVPEAMCSQNLIFDSGDPTVEPRLPMPPRPRTTKKRN